MPALILDAARTPFGRYRGGLSGVRVDDLAALPISELMRRHSATLDPARVDDVVYGNTNGAGEENRNIGRMAALLAGLPVTVPGTTVNRLCASGGEAVVQAGRAISAGDAEVVIAGGVEGMSRAPFVVPRPERAMPDRMELVPTLGWRLVNRRMRPEWTVPMGLAAERAAAELGIDRTAMDQFALRSHRRAAAAWDAGVHDGFVFPVLAPDSAHPVRRDESVRPEASAVKLASLNSAFSTDGPVTAGNSSPFNDGAVALLLGTERTAAELRVRPLGELAGSAVVACEPQNFLGAAASAVRKLLARLGVAAEDVALWEINEAFAAVVLALLRHLPEIAPERVNVHGGAIAYGHPLGASTLRVLADLCRHLRARGGGIGVAVSCVAVGQAQAIAVRT
ncbi:thiolase family protein [Allokutzneria albata]|uniref:Probable acetyl-CoA acetyltransferase n=1 Tax=Allokutzneria albata TaxID=211114 RepID=A0A1H0AEE6_ALLAB|nr:thiolase family protein [Allokutzneria albata]SDN31691.1 acetyl-CoA acetyltransferases [Allokutzneria albata]